MGTLSVTHIGSIIGILWVLSWVGAIAFVGHNTSRANTARK
jgi:hypothetical protein